MARVRPVRVASMPPGIYQTGALPGYPPRSASSFSAASLPQPAAEQPPKLHDHAADMLVLAVVEPVPVVRQPQVEPHPVQR
jgi:hypothetical protein